MNHELEHKFICDCGAEISYFTDMKLPDTHKCFKCGTVLKIKQLSKDVRNFDEDVPNEPDKAEKPVLVKRKPINTAKKKPKKRPERKIQTFF